MTNATIDDVAVLAGVSIKTVSRVVNHESNVRDATREKVEKAIAELNYRPNPSARSLAGNRSFLLGLIYGAPGAHYVLDIQGGILDVCRPLGYELIVHPADSRDENVVDDVIALIKEKRVDAVMLTPPLSDNLDVIKHLIKMKIAFVRVAPTQEKNASPYVETNDVDAAYDMTQQLISLGHSRIGFVCGHPDHKAVYSRYDGYLQALKENGIPLDKKLVAFGNNHFESGVACGEKLLDLPEPPTAIFAANDDMAAGVMMVAHQRGVAIPTELSVAGYDDTPVAQQLWPSLSTVRQPILQMARKATDLLLKSVRGKEVSMQGIMLASSVIVRDSIAVCAKKNQ